MGLSNGIKPGNSLMTGHTDVYQQSVLAIGYLTNSKECVFFLVFISF